MDKIDKLLDAVEKGVPVNVSIKLDDSDKIQIAAFIVLAIAAIVVLKQLKFL